MAMMISFRLSLGVLGLMKVNGPSVGEGADQSVKDGGAGL
jgi:hypothetical protein